MDKAVWLSISHLNKSWEVRQESITGSLSSYTYGDLLSMDLDGICWQDHFLYWIVFLTVAFPRGSQPRWSQPR